MTKEWLLRIGLSALLVAGPNPASGVEDESSSGLFIPVANTAVEYASDVDRQLRPFLLQETQSVSNTEEPLRSGAVRIELGQFAAVRQDVAQGAPARVRLNLFEDVDLNAVIERTAKTRFGYSLSGRIEGQPHGSVTLVVSGDIVAGAVHSQQGMYVIGSQNGAIHSVREVTGDFKCAIDGHSHPDVFPAMNLGTLETVASDGDDGSEVDLLVVFTEAALNVEGGLNRMRASIDLAVAYANDAFEASGVNLRLNLIAAAQVDYRESTLHGQRGLFNQREDLNRLIDGTDGFLDEAHTLRDSYAADVVHFIVDQINGGGRGSILRHHDENPAAWAYSISNSLSGYPPFLAHEVGHVMGLRHDRYSHYTYNQPFSFPPYWHGYVNQRAFEDGAQDESRWRTIMAYDAQCRDEGFWCPTVQRFSNPNLTYRSGTGDPLGVPGDQMTTATAGPADAVRGLNENRILIANFRESASRCDYGLSETRREIRASGGVFRVNVGAASSCQWTATASGDFIAIDSAGTGNGAANVSYRVEANEGPARVGYIVVAGETLSVYQSGSISPASICGRTPQVRDAIVSATGRGCDAVSQFDLLEVVRLDLAAQKISALEDGDFTGLRNLVELDMARNQLAGIPRRAFRDLANLKRLNLQATALADIPVAIRELPSLQKLDLSANSIEELHSDAFSGLSALRDLRLYSNRLRSLPDGVFSELENLAYLHVQDNRLTDVRKEALRGPLHLIGLDLSRNPLVKLREDAFANISNVIQLRLVDTRLSSISAHTFAGLTELGWLWLSDNRIEDISDVVFPGNAIGSFHLANNALQSLPPGMFEAFTSPICSARNLDLNLSGNPGAPFPLTLELKRIDADPAASGPAAVVVRVREGASWPMTVRVAAEGGSTFTKEVTVVNGEVESEPFYVAGDDLTRLRFAAGPDVPGSYNGVRIELGEDLRLFALADRELGLGAGPLKIELDETLGEQGVSNTYEAVSSAAAVAAVNIADGSLIVEPRAHGTVTITVTATAGDGTQTVRSFDMRVVSRSTEVAYMSAAGDERRQGLVRVINHSAEPGEVRIEAFDEEGTAYGPLTMPIAANGTLHFTSEDLERGNATEGLSGGVGTGQGGWRLELESERDIEVLTYIRTADGFLTAMHDFAPEEEDGTYRVAIFNPGSDMDQLGVLRLVNTADEDATVTIRGIDDDGMSPGSDVEVSVPAGRARSFSAAELEAGSGVTGALGDGEGRWQLVVSSNGPVRVMSLLESPGGHLTNLSTSPVAKGPTWTVPLLPSASDALQRQGLVRVINRGDTTAEVSVQAFDESVRDYHPSTLTVNGGKTVHFDSNDLELGNTAKGLSGSTGAGIGDWWLELESGSDVEVLSYIVTPDGFLTSVHDAVPSVQNRHRIVTFNPGRNVEQVSRLRMINAGEDAARVTIRGVDDDGQPADEVVRTSVPGHSARTFTAAELELGAVDLDGALGTGVGNWRLSVESDRPITVMSLLGSPTGQLTNLSTIPGVRGGSQLITEGDGAGGVDLFPSFRNASAPGNRTYTVGTTIDALTLPEAGGGNGTLSYSLTPSVPGLSFNATTRRLTGTPTTAATYEMTYTVTDEDGNTDTLNFAVTVNVDASTGGALGDCYPGLLVGIRQSCTYPGTTDEFSVNVRGRGRFLDRLAGIRIRINNETIDGRIYDFEASHQGNGVWRIDRIAGRTEPTT